MKYTKEQAQVIQSAFLKIQRVYAYKYEVPKSEVSILFNGTTFHIMVGGKLKESVKIHTVREIDINESNGKTRGAGA